MHWDLELRLPGPALGRPLNEVLEALAGQSLDHRRQLVDHFADVPGKPAGAPASVGAGEDYDPLDVGQGLLMASAILGRTPTSISVMAASLTEGLGLLAHRHRLGQTPGAGNLRPRQNPGPEWRPPHPRPGECRAYPGESRPRRGPSGP